MIAEESSVLRALAEYTTGLSSSCLRLVAIAGEGLVAARSPAGFAQCACWDTNEGRCATGMRGDDSEGSWRC